MYEHLDKEKLNKYYNNLNTNINLDQNEDDLLFVKCKLFLRIKEFAKNIENSEIVWTNSLKIHKNKN